MLQGAPAVWACVRSEWRVRWRGLMAVALLAGVAGAVTLTAAAGARRSATTFDRLAAATHVPNLNVILPDEAADPDPRRLEQVGRIPGVEAAGQGAVLTFAPATGGFTAGVNTIAGGMAASVGGGIHRMVVDEGRLFDQDRVDEIMVNPTMARALDAHPGDRITLVSVTEKAFRAAGATGEPPKPDGPTVEVTIVGVGRVAEDVSDAPEPAFGVTTAFVGRYADEVARETGTIGVVAEPARLDEVRARLLEVYPGAAVEADDSFERRIEDGIRVQVVALWTFAGVAAAAGTLAAGQAVARHAFAFGSEHPVRRALGMTNRQLVAAGTLLGAPATAVAAVVALAGAVAASPLLPAGLAGQAEPDPGVVADALVLPLGTVALVVLLTAAAAGSAWLAAVRGRERAVLRPSSAARLAARLGLSPVALTGVRHALEPGHGASTVPVRSVLTGAVIGVAGVAAVITFAAGVAHLFDTPRLWGASHDAEMEVGSNRGAIDEAVRDLTADDDIESIAIGHSLENVKVAARRREVATEVNALDPRKGTIDVVVQSGRPPTGPDEVAIGRARLRELGLDLGGTLEVDGTSGPVRLRVVGVAVNPGHDEVDSAMFVTTDALPTLAGEPPEGAHLLVGLAPGAERVSVAKRHPSLSFAARPPSIIDNLDELGSLPAVLAGFLASLATVAAAHGLVTAVRRRRRDLAVLRALGFTRGQVAASVGWQSVVIASIALVVGVPAGVAVGRQVYAVVARGIGVIVEPVTPAVALALIVPAALTLALLAAAGPGRAASRLRPALVLRAE